MWKCNKCEHIWDEDELKERIESNDYEIWGSPYTETNTYYVCPDCDSSDLDEISSRDIEICEECGELFEAEYEDEVHCNHCKKKLGVEI